MRVWVQKEKLSIEQSNTWLFSLMGEFPYFPHICNLWKKNFVLSFNMFDKISVMNYLFIADIFIFISYASLYL